MSTNNLEVKVNVYLCKRAKKLAYHARNSHDTTAREFREIALKEHIESCKTCKIFVDGKEVEKKEVSIE